MVCSIEAVYVMQVKDAYFLSCAEFRGGHCLFLSSVSCPESLNLFRANLLFFPFGGGGVFLISCVPALLAFQSCPGCRVSEDFCFDSSEYRGLITLCAHYCQDLRFV